MSNLNMVETDSNILLKAYELAKMDWKRMIISRMYQKEYLGE